MDHWTEVADGVLVRRHEELDLSTGLVLGDAQALVVDTRGDEQQGRELLAAVRDVTDLPLQLVITHGHFDHCFGTAAFAPTAVWAHEGCAAHLERTAEAQRDAWVEHYRAEGRAATADALRRTGTVLPDRPVHDRADVDLGGRRVRLRHLGAGHTDHDLVVEIPDSATVLAGDLVENGAPPDFEDAAPRQWPSALDFLAGLRPRTVVPGHGDPVDVSFVADQRDDIARLAQLCVGAATGSITEDELVERSPYPSGTTLAAYRRTVS